MQKQLMSVVLWIAFVCVGRVFADLPLPNHQIEGNSGVFITPTAYFTNAPAEGKILGLPSVSVTGAFIGEKDAQSYVVTENILGKEYANQRVRIRFIDLVKINDVEDQVGNLYYQLYHYCYYCDQESLLDTSS